MLNSGKNRTRVLLVIGVLAMTYLFSFVIAKTDTSAWFISEIEANGKIVNATADDLLLIKPKVMSYDTNCVVNLKIDITNISKIIIPIKINGVQKNVSPGRTLSKPFQKKVSCKAEVVTLHLTGLNEYIDELILVPLKGESLKESVRAGQEDTEVDVAESDEAEQDGKAETEIQNRAETKNKVQNE